MQYCNLLNTINIFLKSPDKAIYYGFHKARQKAQKYTDKYFYVCYLLHFVQTIISHEYWTYMLQEIYNIPRKLIYST